MLEMHVIILKNLYLNFMVVVETMHYNRKDLKEVQRPI